VILEEAPPRAVARETTVPERPLHVLALSARDAESLRTLAERHYDALSTFDDVRIVVSHGECGRAHLRIA